MKTLANTVLILLLILINIPSFSQNKQGFGLIFNEEAFSKIPRMPEQTSGTKSLENISVKKDLLQYAPTFTKQGDILSCVAWATAYYAYSIQYAIQHHVTGRAEIDKIALSAMYPYKKLRPGCQEGLDIFEIAAYMKTKGNIPFDQFAVNVCDKKLPSNIAPIFPIKDFQAVFDYKKDPGEKGIQAVLQAIAYNDLPVVVGMQVGDVFTNLTNSDDYYDPKKEGLKTFGHAMTVVGYDLRKKAFKILNSWGDTWGQQGCFWIKFDDFSKVARAGLILILPDESPTTALVTSKGMEIGGIFGFQYLDEPKSDFVLTAPKHVGNGVYELEKKDWEVRQTFQLLTKNSKAGLSMCVFSINASGKLKLHWPREKDFGLGVSDKLPVKNFDMVIPGPDEALMIEEVGSDYLCVFYSNAPLMNELPAIISRIQSSNGDIHARIKEGLGSRLVSPKNVHYEDNEMRFSAKSSQGDTVPLVLKIESIKK